MIEVWFTRANSPRRRGSTRAVARVILGSVLGIPPAQVPIRRLCLRCGSPDHGKPYIEGRPVHFTTSAAGDHVAVAVGPVPLGIDLVDVADIGPGVGEVMLSSGEDAADARGLATVWARKEAILKATGDGLSVDPQVIRVSAPDAPAALLAWPDRGIAGIHVVDIDVPSQGGRVSSLAWLSGKRMRVVVHREATARLQGHR